MRQVFRTYGIFVMMSILLSSGNINAQLSPGDLTDAHAHLEGLSNCTQCHTLGDKVSNEKCMACHEFLTDRIERGQGYHASYEVKGKDCFTCHSEHHGRKFEMIRFDKNIFNHNLTGYQLEGAHKRTDCRECHQADNIIDFEIRAIDDTYLGLTTECLLCHDDYHQNTLSQKCSSCHGFEAFEPAVNFDHTNDTDYPLKGKHVDVDCASCHISEMRNGKEFKVFSGVEHANCNACHDDAHGGNFGTQCNACHSVNGFEIFTGGKGFNHSITAFQLKGKHSQLNCASCHDTKRALSSVFQDYKSKPFNQCNTCHDDVHEGKFGEDCKKCHNENSWRIGGNIDGFDHDLTNFHLEGKHVGVDCKSCHTSNLTDPLAHAKCTDCHQDYHEGQLINENKVRECSDCHTVFGFPDHLYTFEDHLTTDFPLEGAHLATPCFACHVSDERWIFKDLDGTCTSCHENIHEGRMDPVYYEDKACTYCHNSEMWSDVDFDHNQTDFPLEGRHEETRCAKCHFDDGEGGQQTFANLSQDCYFCHEDAHRGQFNQDGITDCSNCHSPLQWRPSKFDHDSTAFPLEGAHVDVDCRKCHIPDIIDGVVFVDYNIERFECIDCHQ